MNQINKKRSETMKLRWKEGRFKNRKQNLKGVPKPGNKKADINKCINKIRGVLNG